MLNGRRIDIKNQSHMDKHLLSIEFRYHVIDEDQRVFKSQEVTMGIYDTFDDACFNGNKLLETLEEQFEFHKFPDGKSASKERFSKNGGPFGTKKNLITNLAYLKTPFEFYAKIKTVKYLPIDKTIDDIVSEINK